MSTTEITELPYEKIEVFLPHQDLTKSVALIEKQSAGDIFETKWDNVTSVRRATEGSSGVFILSRSGRKVVLKSTSKPAQELFAHLIALRINVGVPKVRLLDYSSGEYNELIDHMKDITKDDPALLMAVERFICPRCFFIVMEYVKGAGLVDRLVSVPHVLSPEEPTGVKMLRQIGHLISLDILLNNLDRLPVVWDHDDINLGNLLIQHNEATQETRVIGIDQAVHSISAEFSGFQKYLNTVDEFLKQITSLPLQESDGMKRVRTAVRDFCGIELGEKASIEMQIGVLETGKKIVDEINKEVLLELKEKLRAVVENDWREIWKSDVDGINIDFLAEVIQIFHSNYDSIVKALQEANNIKISSGNKNSVGA